MTDTNVIIYLFGAFAVAYLCGSIPFGFLIGKLHGVDIRKVGSCNIGATNVTRTFGKKWGVPCFFLDAIKGALPLIAISAITFAPECKHLPPWMITLAVVGVVLGHMFPCWLNFKGGKGVSTIIGALVVIAPLPVLTGLIFWLITFYTFKYVSLASIVFAIIMPLAQNILPLVFKKESIFAPYLNNAWQISALITLLSILMVVKHRTNIKRLLNGTENRFVRKSKTEQPSQESGVGE